MNKSQGIGIATCVISCIGTAVTGYFVYRGTKKDMQSPKTDELTSRANKIKRHLKYYWPAYLSGGITMASNVTGCVFSYKSIGGLTTTIAGLSVAGANYKKIVQNTIGEEQYQKVVKNIVGDTKAPEGKKLYYNEYTGVFFATEQDVALAQKRMNDVLNDRKADIFYYISDFLNDAKAELRDPQDFKPYEKFGWYRGYLIDRYDSTFVHAVESSNERIEYSTIQETDIPVLRFIEEPIFFEVLQNG